MKTRLSFYLALIAVSAFMTGCSVFPGLRVLTGEAEAASGNRAVSELDLVMADKTGATDPSLIAAADRIEAASLYGDVIEIRENPAENSFDVSLMLWVQPAQTQEEQLQQYDEIRKIQEYTWLALLPQSEDVGQIRITFIAPLFVNTIDNGESFLGRVVLRSVIDRADAADYLTRDRNLMTFSDMIVSGRMSMDSPQTATYYEGQPNHPLLPLEQSGS
jgi:hypothetical protein